MQSSQIPSKFPIPFANGAGSGYIRQIPVASQISVTPGAASLTDGFPPLTFIPEGSGGIPPFGQDMNGILKEITAWIQWGNAGAPVIYDATFSAAIGGYPKGTILTSAAGGSWWLSTAENNLSNPDTGGAGWQYLSYGLTYAGNPNGNVAGVAATNGALAASLLWDTVHSLLWVCTTTGTSTTAVWTTTNPVSESTWCATSSGTGNAQILGVPFASFPAGTGLAWMVGASQTNTGATSVKVGAFGSFPVVKDTPTGPVPLTGGELKSGNVVICRFDGTSLHLINGVNIYANLNGSPAQPFQVAPATSPGEALNIGQAQANFAALAGLSTQVFNAAPATTATEVLPLGQVYQQLSIAANQSLTLTALETLVFSNGLTSNIAITLEPGTIQGQKVRFMSGNPTTYWVTVNSTVSSGSPAFYFPDGTSTYSTGPTNSTPQGSLLCQWDGTNWHCQTTGLNSIMVCCEQQPSGTNGGSSVAGLQTRILNTVLWNSISGASLSSNEITLPAGTYDIRADLPASTTTGIDHRGYLYIPSTSTISLLGSSASAGGSVTVSEIEGMLNTAGVTFNIQHWISVAQATTGLGIASGMGLPEVYTQIFIRKVE